MADNKPLNLTEQENLAQEALQQKELLGKSSLETKEDTLKTPEQGGTKETEALSGEETAAEPSAVPVKYAKLAPRPEPKPIQFAQIENILSEDLKEAFLELNPDQQIKFKREGERVAGIIFQMLISAKIQVKKIVDLIAHWLKRLPGVNKYFIEQESKIKADKIINMIKHDGA